MATWTITGSQDTTYVGAALVDRVVFATSDDTNGYIAAQRLVSISIVDRGTVLLPTVVGGAGEDQLIITSQSASINASAVTFENWTDGEDNLNLRTGPGSGRIVGSGRDDFVFLTDGDDSVDGGAGNDTLGINYSASVPARQQGLAFTMIAGGSGIGNGAGTSVRWADIESLSVALGSGADSVTGLAGDDRLGGFGGADRLDGGAGDDVLYGGAGNDVLLGGSGADFVRGDDGNDTLHGGTGSDDLGGDDGNDALDGGSGSDTLRGGAGNDTYQVDVTGDRVLEDAAGGADTIISTISLDLLAAFPNGSVENLRLTGTAALNGRGSETANTLAGNAGANVLVGRGGRDVIDVAGDAAADTVAVRFAVHSTGAGRDQVRGFDAAAEDLLDLRVGAVRVQSVAAVAGGRLDAATFNADVAAALDAAFTAGGVQAILWDPSLGTLDAPGLRQLVVDLDNEGLYKPGADLVLELLGMTGTLDLGDFILT